MGGKESKQPWSGYGPYSYSVAQNLRDAGCTDQLVEEYLALEGKDEQQLRLLTAHRKALLEKLHQQEERIDCLDYLLYRMQSKG